MLEKKITFDSFIRGLIVVVSIICVVVVLNYLQSVLLPFFVAWFIAYLIYPLVHFFQFKLKLRSRILSIIATLALIAAIVYAFCAFTFPQIATEVEHFKEIMVKFLNDGTNNKSISPQVEKFFHEQAKYFRWDELINKENVINVIKEAVPRVWSVIYETANVVITLISSCIAILYLFFILFDYEKLTNGVMKLFPRKNRSFFETLFGDLKKGMNSYFRGQALISISVGILFSIGFVIIGFPLAIPLGLFIGVLSFIPYLHALGLIPAVLLALLKAANTGQNFWIVLISCLAVFAIVQIIQDTLLTPKIMGDAMGLPPFLILLSLSVWGYVLGVIGIIIALPMTTLIISYYRRYITKDTSSETSIEKRK